MLISHKVILWDFDGVLINSGAVRDLGFEQVLADYPAEQVAQVMNYHRVNGGLSRYVKFRYFFEQILKQKVTDVQVQNLAKSFSEIMHELLVNPDLLIADSLHFAKEYHLKREMHIDSGSDQIELRYLCNQLNIDQYFKTINGSPTPKTALVKNLLKNLDYKPEDVVLIGDSINDYEAAEDNGIKFIGYNNIELKKISSNYITSFSQLNFSYKM